MLGKFPVTETTTLTKDDLLQRIQTDTPSAIRFYQQHATLDMGILRELSKEIDTVPGVSLFLASVPNTPSRVLESLESSQDEAVLHALAQNPNCVARMAVNAKSRAARLAAAQSRRLMPAQMLRLAVDSDVDVRVALAKNPAIPSPVQLKLSQDAVPFVRAALLENRKLVEEFQIGLGDDIDTAVHLCTLLLPKLSPACVDIWSKENEELAQIVLSQRSDLPPQVIEQLSRSPFPSVLLSLLEHQKISEESLAVFAEHSDEATALALLRRENLSSDLQRTLWQKHGGAVSIRKAFARHPALMDEIGVSLVETGDPEVRHLLAESTAPALTETRRLLTRHSDNALRKLLLANPLFYTPELLEEIVLQGDQLLYYHIAAREIDCSALSDKARERLQKSPFPNVRNLVNCGQEQSA